MPFLTAHWRSLAMLNFAVDPALLEPLRPRGTELDTWEGKHYASVVGFRFEDTRLRGLPIPFHRHFDEVNLRFYVRRKGPEGWRRGVVFVKEIVPRWAIATVARVVYNENYVALPMRSRVEEGHVSYSWSLGGAWSSLELKPRGDWAPMVEGSEAQFIAEHYWGYAAQRDGGCMEYEVTHPPWRVKEVAEARLLGDLRPHYGEAFARALSGLPTSAFLAEGSPVSVQPGGRIC